MISTNKGRVIRVAVKEIRSAGRNTQGVRIIKLSGDEKVVSAIKLMITCCNEKSCYLSRHV